MTTERMIPKYPPLKEPTCETKAEIQLQLDINEMSLTQLNETVSELSKRLATISLPGRLCGPLSMDNTVEPEEISPLRKGLRDLDLRVRRIIIQVEDLMSGLEI